MNYQSDTAYCIPNDGTRVLGMNTGDVETISSAVSDSFFVSVVNQVPPHGNAPFTRHQLPPAVTSWNLDPPSTGIIYPWAASLNTSNVNVTHFEERQGHERTVDAVSAWSRSSSLSTCSDCSGSGKDHESTHFAAPDEGKAQAVSPSSNTNCVVCSDKSSGKHYGRPTCEGCKSFFKRSVRRDLKYTCRNVGSCPVDTNRRNQCQHCRLKKCLAVGMRKEAVQRGRVPTGFSPYSAHLFGVIPVSKQSCRTNSKYNSSVSSFLTLLINADPYCQRLGSFLPVIAARQGGLLEADRVGELAARLLFSAIGFAKNLPVFNEFSLADQIALLCSSWSELFLLNVAQCNVHLHAASLLAFSGLHCMSMAGERVSMFLDQIGVFQDRVKKMQDLRMDVAEYSCLKALVLFSPDAFGLYDLSKAASVQEKSQMALEGYCNRMAVAVEPKERPDDDLMYKNQQERFGRLLLRLPSLRSISGLVEQLFFARTVGTTSVEAVIRDLLVNSKESTHSEVR